MCNCISETLEWKEFPINSARPEPRSHHCSVVFGNKFIVFSGLSGLSVQRLHDVQMLDLGSVFIDSVLHLKLSRSSFVENVSFFFANKFANACSSVIFGIVQIIFGHLDIMLNNMCS